MRIPIVALGLLVTILMASGAEPSVTLHLLDHTGDGDTENRNFRSVQGDKRPLFWIDWSKHWRAIVLTKKVSGPEAEGLVALFRQSLASSEATHFCGHNPIYGIEAAAADGKTLKTSVCFSCCTWVQQGARLNIIGPMGLQNPLSLALRKVIELPKTVLDADAAMRKKQTK